MMPQATVEQQRIHRLNEAAPNSKGNYVLYWMQQAQRVHLNHALHLAVSQANNHMLPVLVVFGLSPDYPEANWRHFAFMLEGLAEVERSLSDMGIAMQVRIGSPSEVALAASENAALAVCDRGYLRHQRQWRQQVAQKAACPVIEVESDAIIPVAAASGKAEFAARTIRGKIQRQLPALLNPLPVITPRQRAQGLYDRPDFSVIAGQLKVDRTIHAVAPLLTGGYSQVRRQLDHFIQDHLSSYTERRSKLDSCASSHMSPYLHFGQISPLEVAIAIQKADAPIEAREAFLEELIVRRELAINHVWFNPLYDQYKGLPAWARRTLAAHRSDPRQPSYSYRQLSEARTHDSFWNAAMCEMRETGFMPNYMRMYWGKKILQWQSTPWHAFASALRLNNTYFVDGRDPNSYAGVGWIFGLHDRPWQERPVYGQIRYMARAGLKRKFNMQAYLEAVEQRISMIRSDDPTI